MDRVYFNFYFFFHRDYVIMAKPLTNLLQKNGFVWTEEATKAFNHMKQLTVSLPESQTSNSCS